MYNDITNLKFDSCVFSDIQIQNYQFIYNLPLNNGYVERWISENYKSQNVIYAP